MPNPDLLAVRLGALALAVVDAQQAQHPEALALEAPDAPLLNSIAQTPGLKVEELAAILALSHSGTVRALDRLARKGLVRRQPHRTDARAVALHLTEEGARMAAALQEGRKAALREALAALDPDDIARTAAVVDLLLAHLIRQRSTCDRACRLCDEALCPPNSCPAEHFARTTH